MKSIFVYVLFTLFSGLSFATETIPGQELSGNETLDTALMRYYKMAYAPKCTAKTESYEYIAPLLTEAISEDPYLVTDYLMKIPGNAPVAEIQFKNLYEYQIAKIKAYKQITEEQRGEPIDFDEAQQMEHALNRTVFRVLSEEDEFPQELLQFTLEYKDDGSENRFVRWVVNYIGFVEGKKTWKQKRLVYAQWSFKMTGKNKALIKVNDKENDESLTLLLEKIVVEDGKPAQWTLTDEANGLQFLDYFTGFCDDPKYY